MDRTLTIYYTSDLHGYFAPMDYARCAPAPRGLANCAANFVKDGNTLVIDGGDTLQGSPFACWLMKCTEERSAFAARCMNLAGVDFFTLGNHDFDYGPEELERYIAAMDGVCLCANVEGLRGVQKTAVVTLENGLRVGLTGVTSHFVTRWEKPEKLRGLTVTDAFRAAWEAMNELNAQDLDLTLCIYHGGFEVNLKNACPVSDTGENQGWQMCRELNFDILLTGHQHMPVEDTCLFWTYVCQPPDKGVQYARMTATVDDNNDLVARSKLFPAGDVTPAGFRELLAEPEREAARFLDTPIGRLDVPLPPDTPIRRAQYGSLMANFFNQVQREASGAALSCTSLANSVRGFSQEVTVRDIAASYVFPNTLRTIVVDRAVLVRALERTARYFAYRADGELRVSEDYLSPIVQHYNFDFIAGIEATIDLRRWPGERVVSIRYEGAELPPEKKLTLCLNSYRASGAGGCDFYADCESVDESTEEIAELIMAYVERHRDITVDKTQWLHVLY